MRNVRVVPVRWRRLVLVAAAAVAVMVVPACTKNVEPPPLAESSASPGSGSPSPTPTPTPTPSQAPTATPTPTPTSTFPPGSLEDQLYKATVNFYSAVTEAYHVMDDDPIKPVIVPGTRAGGGYVQDIQQLKQKKHKIIPVPTFKVPRIPSHARWVRRERGGEIPSRGFGWPRGRCEWQDGGVLSHR